MATGLVATRSRVNERVNRVSTNLDRSSGYLLGQINATPTSANIRRNRDSSVGAMGRANLDGAGVRYRDSSLTRGGRMSAADNNRHSLMIPTSTETAKYGREQAIKEIHTSFMKTYKETNNKLKNDKNEDNSTGERRSKAYQKIISNAQPSYMDEAIAKRQCVSEMFMDTNKFSTKTLSAINGLEGAVIRKNKEYNWRKEMEEYEKRADFERDVRARNVTALHRHENEEDPWETQQLVNQRKRQTNTVIEKPIEKAAKQESQTVKSWRERREAAKAVEAEPEVERKSWREKLAEKQQKEEEEKKIKAVEAEEARKQAAAVAAQAVATAETSADSSATAAAAPAGDAASAADKKPEEEEDASGTKKIKGDFDFMMSGLEQEMEAGRSKLAKLRERIRKAKNAIKDADAALAEDDKKIENQKNKKK